MKAFIALIVLFVIGSIWIQSIHLDHEITRIKAQAKNGSLVCHFYDGDKRVRAEQIKTIFEDRLVLVNGSVHLKNCNLPQEK